MTRTPRARIAALALFALALAPRSAWAQDEARAEAATPTRPAPPPIMVVVLTSGRVPEEIASAVQLALVHQLEPMAGGRPVLALGAAEIRDAIAACRDDACIGGQLAQAGAQAGVIARLRARGRNAQVTIEIRDPVSGALRREPIEGELPMDAAAIPSALSALTEALEGAMPNPPPPPATLLVTVDVDGATVLVNGEEIGVSPMAPTEVPEGQLEVVVRAPDHLAARRQIRVEPGEQARLDVTLSPIGADAVAAAAEPGESPSGGDITGEWWFWTAIGGGAAIVIGVVIGIAVAVGSSSQGTPDPSGVMLPPIVGGI